MEDGEIKRNTWKVWIILERWKIGELDIVVSTFNIKGRWENNIPLFKKKMEALLKANWSLFNEKDELAFHFYNEKMKALPEAWRDVWEFLISLPAEPPIFHKGLG